jgi:hypothetical protein
MDGNYPDGINGGEDCFNPPAEIIEDPELDEVTQFIVAQALYKAIAEKVKTGKKGNMRGRIDAHFAELWEKTRAMGAPAKSFDLEVNGTKVGTYSITAAAAEPEHDENRIVTTDEEALLRWCMERGFIQVDRAKVENWINDTGELPDGIGTERVHVEAKPARISRTTVRIPKPFEALYALGEGHLEQSVLELMEGGE